VIALRLNLRRGESTLRFGAPEWSIPDGDVVAREYATAQLAGKRVLALIHGYNVRDAMDAYARIALHVYDLYDVIVAVTWPGSPVLLGFWWARRRAAKAGKLLALALGNIPMRELDIEGHSLGCCVALETVVSGLAVRDLILAAAAVDNESIEYGERYGEAISRMRRVLIAYSARDEALQWGYRLAAWDTALGLAGPRRGQWIPQSIQSLNVSETVAHHGDYKSDERFFRAWRNA
jgi:esterase/lipase superfamily enzyme